MYKELFNINYEDLVCYIEDVNIINKIMDIIKYLNFFNKNEILNMKPEETNFNIEIENIVNYEHYTSSDKRTEIIYLVIEETTECLNLMGIKTNEIVKLSLTDLYNITFKIYNSLLDNSIKELNVDNNDELTEYLFDVTENDGTDYCNNILEVTPYFVNNYNRYKNDIIDTDEDYTVDEKIQKLMNIDPSYCTSKVIIDYLSKETLETNKEEYLSTIVKDKDSIDKYKIELTAFAYLYYTLEEYNNNKDNIVRLLSLYNLETNDIDNITEYIENTVKGLSNE